jgi:hypothetical protein
MQEIYQDELWNQLKFWAEKISPCTILEIGGGTGDGSTTAFFDAVKKGSKVYSVEGRKERWEELRQKPVEALFGCSVSLGDYMSKKEVKDFYHNNATRLNDTPLKVVLGWLKEELSVLKSLPQNVIKGINADFVFIDGSPFTGEAEFRETVQSNPQVKIVALDDVMCIKNYANYIRLNNSDLWEKAWENLSLRNGAAIFVKKTLAQ